MRKRRVRGDRTRRSAGASRPCPVPVDFPAGTGTPTAVRLTPRDDGVMRGTKLGVVSPVDRCRDIADRKRWGLGGTDCREWRRHADPERYVQLPLLRNGVVARKCHVILRERHYVGGLTP